MKEHLNHRFSVEWVFVLGKLHLLLVKMVKRKQHQEDRVTNMGEMRCAVVRKKMGEDKA